VEVSVESSPFKPVLDELEALLDREREALRRLDQAALAETTEHKLHLDEQLTRLAALVQPTSLERDQLAHIKRSARINQLLLVHARSCVQGALQLATGEAYQTPSLRQSPTTQNPVAVNIRT
jgi:hypothetical protein